MTPAERRITRIDPEYPPLLREIADPPVALNVIGLPLEPRPMLAIVGARKPTAYGLEVAEWFAGELARAGLLIVSGMARGIDGAAHQGALDAGASSVAVLGCGLDICYPRANHHIYRRLLESGTIVSEYPSGTAPLPHHFPTRNRIIAGMSLGALIVEGRPEGGAMITARLSMEFSREVFAVPGPVHSPVSLGPHLLIRDGARIITSPLDILEELGLSGQLSFESDDSPAAAPDLSPEESMVLAAMQAQPVLLDIIASAAGIPASTASAILARLELKDLVARHAGSRFSATAQATQVNRR
ncbi:MAG: DNA-processing protein DprA [Actinobacteria bacterium]|nr:DNA-processing protein DprA [Actinomycetota bacterium]